MNSSSLVTRLNRLASYRPVLTLLSQCSTPFCKLSDAGFRYSGQKDVITCDGCNKSISMTMVLSPLNALYHNQGCEMISVENESNQELIGAVANEPNTVVIGDSLLEEVLKDDELKGYSIQKLSHSNTNRLLVQSDIVTGSVCQNEHVHKKHSKIDQQNVEMSKLPPELREKKFCEFLIICSKLAVTIECKEKGTIGSGYVLKHACKIIKKKSSDSRKDHEVPLEENAEKGLIFVETNCHVLPSDVAPASIEMIISLDRSSCKNIMVKGKYVLYPKNASLEKRILVCVTENLGAVHMINQLQRQMKVAGKKLSESVKLWMKENIVMIGPPHQDTKYISVVKFRTVYFGVHECELVETMNGSAKFKALQYKTSTCLGSAGAPILTVKESSTSSYLTIDVWAHNGIDKNGCGISVCKASNKKIRSIEVSAASSSLALGPMQDQASRHNQLAQTECSKHLSTTRHSDADNHYVLQVPNVQEESLQKPVQESQSTNLVSGLNLANNDLSVPRPATDAAPSQTPNQEARNTIVTPTPDNNHRLDITLLLSNLPLQADDTDDLDGAELTDVDYTYIENRRQSFSQWSGIHPLNPNHLSDSYYHIGPGYSIKCIRCHCTVYINGDEENLEELAVELSEGRPISCLCAYRLPYLTSLCVVDEEWGGIPRI